MIFINEKTISFQDLIDELRERQNNALFLANAAQNTPELTNPDKYLYLHMYMKEWADTLEKMAKTFFNQ